MTGLILKARIPILILIPTVFVILKIMAPPPRFDNSVESMTDQDDPALQALYDFRDTFGSEEDIFVGIEAEDIFAPEVLRTIAALTTSLEELDNVASVISIATATEMVGGDAALEIKKLMPELPQTPEARAALRERVLSDELYRNQLVSADGRVAGMVARTVVPDQQVVDGVDFRRLLTDEGRRIVAEHCDNPMIKICHIVGPPLIKMDLVEMSRSDMFWFLPTAVLLIGFVLALIFRSATAVILSGLSVYLSLDLTLSLFLLSGRLMTMVTVIITPLILVIGLTASIHLISRLGEKLRAGASKDEALRDALHHVGIATLLTSLTTAAGFLSLVVSPVVPVREFGVLSAVGIMITLVVSMTFIPAALSVLPAPRISDAVVGDGSITGRVVRASAHLITAHRRPIWLVSLLVAVVAVIGISRVEVETILINFFPKDNPLRAAYLFVNDNLSGISPMEVVFESDEEGTFKEPDVLRQVDAYRAWLAAREEPGKVLGLTDLLKELNQAMEGGAEEAYRLPDSRAAVAQYLLLYESAGDSGVDIFDYVTDDFRQARLSARLHLTSSAGYVRLFEDLVAWGDAHPIPGVRVKITGASILYANMVERLIESQVRSFGLALCVIFLVMTLLFRSLRVGAVSMIPNIIPIALAGGVMGWAGFNLTISTAMIASVAIGIAVDDTIHFLVRFKFEFDEQPDYLAACRKVILTTGRPVIFTSLVITAGFLLLITSNFQPNLEFGALTAVAMVSAMLADLSVTPAALILFKPIRRSKRPPKS